MTVEEHYSDKVQVGTDFKLVANRRNEYLLDREKQNCTAVTVPLEASWKETEKRMYGS